MKIRAFLLFLLIILLGTWSFPASASSLSTKLSGRIVLSVEENGEAWYIHPLDLKRYYLGRPNDAFQVMRELGLGISELNFQEIAQAGMPVAGNTDLAKRLAGRIVLQVEQNGEAWYINPVDLKKYYLGRPADAFRVMRALGLGISRADLALIHKPGLSESINQYSDYRHSKMETSRGLFTTDIVRIDLSNPNLEILTLTADDEVCRNKVCAAKNLASYVFSNNAFAGINASYFCNSSSCGGVNYYFAPVYNSLTKSMVNNDQLKYWTTGPVVAFDENNKFYYFKDSREFKSVSDFEEKFGVKLQAAISNRPRLLENGMNVLIDWETDLSQRNSKLTRNVLAYRENLNNPGLGELYLVFVQRATLDDVAILLQSLKMDYALNLDGGFSSALIYNGEYMLGPGRNVPNAIVFKQ
jgi:hypothetical protein